MAGRTPAEAVHAFLDPLRRALSCVTRDVLDVGGGYHAHGLHAAQLAGGLPTPLAGDRRARLIVHMHYRVVEDEGPRGPWKVRTAAYAYEMTEDDESRIIAYHWHPTGRSSVTTPHLHLGGTVSSIGRHDAHVPTGRVSLEQVLRFAIVDLAVRPLRSDWDDVLSESQAAFEQWRTWS